MLKTAIEIAKNVCSWIGIVLLAVAAIIMFPFIAVAFLVADKRHPEWFDDFD